jgi:hypothetical protein
MVMAGFGLIVGGDVIAADAEVRIITKTKHAFKIQALLWDWLKPLR